MDDADAERELWDDVLSTDTEQRFREFVVETIPLEPDDSVLSVGCGPGFETAALADRLSEAGHVTGIDLNEAVLDAARERCSQFSNVAFEQGDITDLPVADDSFDLVLAKQVLSEIDATDAALAELRRVLRPGGRLAVTAGDRRTHVKHTPSERMERADDVYRSRVATEQLGTRLAGILPDAGFDVESVVPRAKLQTELNDQVERGIEVQRRFLEASDSFDDADIDAWEDELRALDDAGEFLSGGMAFLYVARKPA